MNIGWQQWIWLAVSSGVAAGVANQLFKFVHDWLADQRTTKGQNLQLAHQEAMQQRELQHRRDLQREEREHQAAIRREDAFFAARKTLLPLAVAVRAWIQWWWGSLYGAEVDYYQISVSQPDLRRPADAISALERIAGEHPSKDIRSHARRLANAIDNRVNMPEPDGNTDPTVDDLRRWSEAADGLIDALHDPDRPPVPVE